MEKEMEHFSVSGSSSIILSDDSQFLNTAKVGHDLSRSIESYDTGSEAVYYLGLDFYCGFSMESTSGRLSEADLRGYFGKYGGSGACFGSHRQRSKRVRQSDFKQVLVCYLIWLCP
ncbi:hypothetical protein CFP56_037562 [Quercus suber]|uniref:Uncharacterized protein n=1 Tax=Quercus suber TaxID=58331 RepID=A0AAW0J557_QUESU